jgi:16S rRNA (cytidine1402-2'-O)-methyltransferase
MPGTLFVVATPIGNLEDITLRALRVLREAAVIAAEDTRRTAHLLARHAIDTPTTSLHEHNESHKSESIVARLLRGDDIALVSDAGSPTIADPGRRLIADAVSAGIRIEPIPGPNAAITALMASGMPADSFTFAGFPPSRGKDRRLWFERLRQVSGIVVFYEAPHRILATLSDILNLIGDRTVVVGRELTKKHEELVRGQISDVIGRLERPRGELTIIIDFGHSIEQNRKFIGQSTESRPISKRAVISSMAQSLGLATNEVYAALAHLLNR